MHHEAVEHRSATPAVIAILLAVGAVALMLYSFVNGVTAALHGTGNPDIFAALFFGGGLVAAGAAVMGIIGLVRGGHRVLSSIAVLIALIPPVGIVLLRLAN